MILLIIIIIIIIIITVDIDYFISEFLCIIYLYCIGQ